MCDTFVRMVRALLRGAVLGLRNVIPPHVDESSLRE